MRVIGLDLTTSPEKATAFAVLSESKIALRGLPNPRRTIPSPQKSLLSHDALDALLAAYTGVLYIKDQTKALGNPAEGLFHIPISHIA